MCWKRQPKFHGRRCVPKCHGKEAQDGETLLWQPVEGWTAEPVKISVRNENGVYREIETYHITACPEFEKG